MEVETKCSMETTDCSDMTKKLLMKSKYAILDNKEEIKNDKNNYIRDNSQKIKMKIWMYSNRVY